MIWKKTGTALVAGQTPRMNLLPPKELEKRETGVVASRWRRATYLALLIVGLEAEVARGMVVRAESDRAAASQVAAQLQSQLAQYSQVVAVESDLRNLNALRAKAGSNDQEWKPLFAEIKSVLPTGVRLIGFRLVPGAAPTPDTDASRQVGLKGTLTFSARATSDQAATISQLRTVNSFIDVDAGELSAAGSSGGFTFVATFTADQTRYTGRFAQDGVK